LVSIEEDEMSNVLIVGGGRIGGYLASLLLDGGHQVTLVEADAGCVERLRRTLPPHVLVHGSGTDPEVLERSSVHRADTVVAVTNRDETNLVVTSLAKFGFRVPRTIGRVNNPRNAWMYTHDMGVDVALNQADIIAHLVAEEMSLGEMMTLLKLRKGRFALVEEQIPPGSAAGGRRLDEVDLPDACVVVGILRGGDLLSPHGSTVFVSGDEVLAVVRADQIAQLASVFGTG
jgi:trk system potassium uptake protein TrkA